LYASLKRKRKEKNKFGILNLKQSLSSIPFPVLESRQQCLLILNFCLKIC